MGDRTWHNFLSQLISIALVGVVAATVRSGRWPEGVLLFALVSWGACRGLMGSTGPISEPGRVDYGTPQPVAVAVRIGSEPDDLVISTVVTSAVLGPVVAFVPDGRDGHRVAEVGPSMQVPDRRGGRVEGPHNGVMTRVALVLSAGAIPNPEGVARASSLLRGDVGWVTGATSELAGQLPGQRCRQLLAHRNRTLIRRAGGVVWEPDATLIRCELLPRNADIPQVLGDLLREGARAGFRGVDTSELLSQEMVLADGRSFWPRQLQETRGSVADLNHALREGPKKARRVELAALTDHLYAFSVIAWAAAPLAILLVGGFPLRMSAVLFWAAAALTGATRWWSRRKSLGINLMPLAEVRSAFAEAPGSACSAVAAITGRIRPLTHPTPSQPLLAAAAALSLITTLAFIDTRGPSASIGLHLSIGLIQLALLWAAAARSIGQGVWLRRSYRVGCRYQATIDGHPVRLFDASPSGIAAAGVLPELTAHQTVDISVSFPDGGLATGKGRIIHIRTQGDTTVVGLSASFPAADRAAWIRHLLLPGGVLGEDPSDIRRQSPVTAPRTRRLLGVLERGVVVLAAGMLLSTLALLGLGWRPVTVISDSMRPAIAAGDLAIQYPIPVTSVRVGDVITLPDAVTKQGAITHRVRSITTHGDLVDLESRGDANTTSERFILGRKVKVQKVTWTVARVGRMLSEIASPRAQWFANSLLMLLVLGAAQRWMMAGKRRKADGPGDPTGDRGRRKPVAP